MKLMFHLIITGIITIAPMSAESDSDINTKVTISEAKTDCLALAEEIRDHLGDLADALSDDDQQYFYISEAAGAWALGIFTLEDLSRDYDMCTILESASSEQMEQRIKTRLIETCYGAIREKVERLSVRVLLDVRRRAKDIEDAYAVVQMLKTADKLESTIKALPAD